MKRLLTLCQPVLLLATLLLGCSKQNSVTPTSNTTEKAGENVSMGANFKIGTLAAPTITCGEATQASINIVVTAGASGAPAGFSVQWMTAADFAANNNTWYASEDTRLCKASFSGNANLSRYNLLANESATVNIGEFQFDNGASTTCPDALPCGTAYVFRAFAHANSSFQRSAFTPDLACSTLACTSASGCTYTQGYWKTHGPLPTGNNAYVWPQSVKDNGLTLGSVTYTADQLLTILTTPSRGGNGLVAMAHQLIAAKLNIANGSDATAIAASLTAADELIGTLVIPPVGSGALKSSATSDLTTSLANYNEGKTGPGHCE